MANYDISNVTVIKGITAITQTISVGSNPRAIGVNPVTNKIYIANLSDGNVTVIKEQPNNPIPLVTSIVSLPNRTSLIHDPTFTFQVESQYEPIQPRPQ